MLFFSRWKTIFILGLVALGLLFAAPNGMNGQQRASMPEFLQNTINLGLDLQGGAHMLLEVDLSSVLDQALNNERTGILEGFREANIRAQTVRRSGNAILGQLRSPGDLDAAMEVIEAPNMMSP